MMPCELIYKLGSVVTVNNELGLLFIYNDILIV